MKSLKPEKFGNIYCAGIPILIYCTQEKIMNRRQIIARIVGFYYIAFGILFLNLLRMHMAGQIFVLVNLIPILILIPSGLMLIWKLKRWAAVVGILGVLMPALIRLSNAIHAMETGNFKIPFEIFISDYISYLLLLVVPPTLGVIFAWREMR